MAPSRTQETSLSEPSSHSAGGPLPIYLNRNETRYFWRGSRTEDARVSVSSRLPQRDVVLPAWDIDEAVWQQTVECVERTLGPFNFEVVLDNPDSDTDQIEVHIGGSPALLELGPRVAGVAPQEKKQCSIVENAVVFVFPQVIGHSAQQVCETVAHEVAHTFGIDHLRDCEDPMSYLRCGERRFRYRESRCGEESDRPCICYDSHNSARMLLERIGPGPRPALWIANLASGDEISDDPEFTVVTNHEPLSVVATVDGTPVGVSQSRRGDDGSYRFRFSPFWSLHTGGHIVSVEAIFGDEVLSEEVTVVLPSLDDIWSTSSEQETMVGGCAVAASDRSGTAALLGLLALARRRRRSSESNR